MSTDIDEFPNKWVVIEWYSDGERQDSVAGCHVFDTRRDAREFKKYRSFGLSSIHKAETGS